MMTWRSTARGQSLLEYAVLIGSVVLAVVALARVFSIRFSEHAQRVEQKYMVF